jgi:hypothetical protein
LQTLHSSQEDIRKLLCLMDQQHLRGVYMNVHKRTFLSLLRLGVDMIHPPHYVSSVVESQSDLALGFIRKEGCAIVMLIGSYRVERYEAIPNCEVVLRVYPMSRKARVLTCYWPDKQEPSSKALQKTITTWLDAQLVLGHNFSRIKPKGGAHIRCSLEVTDLRSQ